MDVDQEAVTASSAAVTADSSKTEEKVEESEISDKEKADDKMEESEISDKEKDKKKAEDSDSEVSSIGDDIPAEAEDQDSAEEADVAQRLVKHRSVNAGQEKVLCQDEKGKTVTLTAGEAATAKPVPEISDEDAESEELIEDDPTMDPTTGRVWKGKQLPPEPASPPRETKYRPAKQRKQNKIPAKGRPKAYHECPEVGTLCTFCDNVTDIYCRKCGDVTCSACRNIDLEVHCGCHASHVCQVDADSQPICLRAEQEEALQWYSGITTNEEKEYAKAILAWRKWARKEIKNKPTPRYLTEVRRSYTSKDSALTEEEFWYHNCREDQSRKDRANVLPSEVYRLDKTWKPDDVLASVSNLLGIQLSGPQKHARESMSLHLRDDPKLTLAVFDFGSLKKVPVCPHDNSRLPREYAVPPRMIAHNAANVIVVFNSDGIGQFESVLADQDVRGVNMSISDIGPKTFVAVRSDHTGKI